MENRTVVKAAAAEHFVSFMTVTRTGKSPHWFAVNYSHFETLAQSGYFIVCDIHSFAEFHRDRGSDTVHVHFTWLNLTGGETLIGWEETVVLPYASLMKFVKDSARGLGSGIWRALSIRNEKPPQMLFYCPDRLRQCLENKIVRRKLVRYLRDHFQMPKGGYICFYGDFLPYSFTFQEYQNGKPGVYGRMILHEQEDMEKANYMIHT